MELLQLLIADCKTTGDIQAKLNRLFADMIEQMRLLCSGYKFGLTEGDFRNLDIRKRVYELLCKHLFRHQALNIRRRYER